MFSSPRITKYRQPALNIFRKRSNRRAWYVVYRLRKIELLGRDNRLRPDIKTPTVKQAKYVYSTKITRRYY